MYLTFPYWIDDLLISKPDIKMDILSNAKLHSFSLWARLLYLYRHQAGLIPGEAEGGNG